MSRLFCSVNSILYSLRHASKVVAVAGLLLVGLFLVGLGSGCQDSDSLDSSSQPFAQEKTTPNSAKRTPGFSDFPIRLESRHIPNPVRLHAKVVSGGMPVGPEAYDELKEWGITTIISVDGARPDIEAAKAAGLKYIHLPHGYNGIPDERAAELARCVQLADGPVYIHCHHGKHRSPAAATVACVGAGLLDPEHSLSVLEMAGTNPHYQGLFQAARQAHPLDQALLDQLADSYPEIAELPPLAEAMVDLGHVLDHLNALQKNDWQELKKHPDISPAHEALILTEIYRELNRTQKVQWPDSNFSQMMASAESSSQKLYQLLESAEKDANRSSFEEWNQQLRQINQQCKSCHVQYRDVPLTLPVVDPDNRPEPGRTSLRK